MFHFEIQHFLILTFKIPIIKNAGNPYNKRFPDKKLTPFGLGGSNGVRLINMAGAEGFEPSARGFGDRCSTN
jgi:hypothetical protein